MSWTTLRTLASTVAAGLTAPSSSLFVSATGVVTATATGVPYLEIAFDVLTLTGSPASVTFGIWRLDEAKIDKIGTITVLAADAAAASQVPTIIELHGAKIWVTVESFSEGSAPTVSGVVRAQAVRL